MEGIEIMESRERMEGREGMEVAIITPHTSFVSISVDTFQKLN